MRKGWSQMTCYGHCFVFHSVLWHWWSGDRKDIWTVENPIPRTADVFFRNSWRRRGNQLTQGHLKKPPLNGSISAAVQSCFYGVIDGIRRSIYSTLLQCARKNPTLGGHVQATGINSGRMRGHVPHYITRGNTHWEIPQNLTFVFFLYCQHV